MQNRRSILTAASIILLAIAVVPMRANDSEAYLVGGALVLKKSTSISMESEELTISPERVRVRYRFRNRSASPVDTRVAFPIASFAIPEEMGSVEDFVASIGFTVTVEGRPIAVEHTVRQSSDSIEVMFHWPMRFPAKSTIGVEHEYRARGGYILPDGREEPAFWRRFAADYCVPSATLAKMRSRPGSAQPVPYILRTGANWVGPIGHFRLVVELGDADLLAMCPTGMKPKGRKRFVLERRNYTPTRDLRIVFVRLAPAER